MSSRKRVPIRPFQSPGAIEGFARSLESLGDRTKKILDSMRGSAIETLEEYAAKDPKDRNDSDERMAAHARETLEFVDQYRDRQKRTTDAVLHLAGHRKRRLH